MFLIPDSYYSIKSTERKGKGVFAEKDIESGTVIGDYLGKIILTEEAVKTEPMGTYYMEVTKTHSALADKDGDGIQLINHGCTPNCCSDNYKGHILYFAIRKIFKGEELTVNYNFGPPDPISCNPCRHICHCGSQFCLGSMHTSGEKDSLIIHEYSKHSEMFEKEISQLEGKMLPELPSYPKTMPDDSFFDLFGYQRQEPTTLNDTELPTIEKLREVIRNTGLTIKLPKIRLQIFGVRDNTIIATRI